MKGTKLDKGIPPEKYRKIEEDAGRGDILPPDPPTYHHLNSFKGIYPPKMCPAAISAVKLKRLHVGFVRVGNGYSQANGDSHISQGFKQ